MNQKTKETIIKLCEAVEIIAYGIFQEISESDQNKILDASKELRLALEKDETIV